ncbi:MAG: GNAT family N-acetyltransferase [Desulfosarcinaceae bacterium]
MENLTIRKMSPDDANDIIRIYKSITQRDDNIDIDQVVAEKALSDGGACFVAEQDGRLVGYIVSYLLTASFGIQRSAWIPTFGVDPDFMGHGIGRALAQAVFDFYKANGIQSMYTSVRWYDTDLLQFMRTLGFDRSEFINLQKRLD